MAERPKKRETMRVTIDFVLEFDVGLTDKELEELESRLRDDVWECADQFEEEHTSLPGHPSAFMEDG